MKAISQAILRLVTCWLTVSVASATTPEAPSGPKPGRSRTVQAEVQVEGDGDTKDTRYRLPLENGTIEVGEYAHQRAIRASDGTAGFRTELAENKQRRVYFSITGTRNKTTYIDIDGDGILDAMENLTSDRLFIWAENTWVEVDRQKVGFSIGDSRRSTEGNKEYVFKDSHWARSGS